MDKPQQYIQGWVEFYKLKFQVDENVLIPRPETELLVDEVLNSIKNKELRSKGDVVVLDIGTGAGNIAISIVKHLTSGVRVVATDVSAEVLEVAKQNAKLHNAESQITFIRSNLLSHLPHALDPKPHALVIVTNLPYIPSARIPYLDSSVKDFEPHVALDGGEDGFELYRQLFVQIIKKNWHPDLIIGEIDYTHGDLAFDEAYKAFPGANIEVKKDLAHKQRIILIR